MFCSNCGKEIDQSSGPSKCPHCTAEIHAYTQNQNPQMQNKNPKALWDDEGPFFTRLWNTWVNVMFHPTKFFSQMPVDKGIGRPLIYAIIVGSFSAICGIIWQFTYNLSNMSSIQTKMNIIFQNANIQPNFDFQAFQSFFTLFSMIIWILISPILVIIWQFIWSGIMHVCLAILGDNKKGFEATFRVIAYANTSPGIFAIIPCCGGIIAWVWSMILVIIGLKEAHKIPTWKVILAYLLPTILCCLCGVVLFGLFGAAILAFWKTQCP